MLRYMISPIIGNGTENNEFRASVSDLANVNVAAVIPSQSSGQNIGHPKYTFAFCGVATTSIAVINAVTNGFVFPDYVLDGRMDGMEASVRAGMTQSLEAYTLDSTQKHFDATTIDSESYRDFLNRLVQQIEPSFNVNNLNVSEVAQ